MASTFISIVMPNFNGAKYLRRALDSFLAQNYQNKELIIVDGKSTDKSHEILQEYVNLHSCVRWLNVVDHGISDAVNIAVKVANGEIIGYLGSDDLIFDGLFKCISAFESIIDFDVVYFNSYTYYIKERRCLLQRPCVQTITLEALLANGTIVGLQNTYFRRRIFSDVSLNVNNRYSMDYEMLLELAKRNAMFLYVDEVATINLFDGNISHNNEGQRFEAALVAQKYAAGYVGPLWGEHLLPDNLRRQKSEVMDNMQPDLQNSLPQCDKENMSSEVLIEEKNSSFWSRFFSQSNCKYFLNKPKTRK